MLGNKNKANWVLAGTTAGYLLAVPFQEHFIGGLLTSGFGAAMVGGAADWFAVTALFRRPLGISFKTAVIPRSRARISRDIVDMVENRLLTKENIRSKIEGYDTTAMLLDFLAEGGKADLVQAIPALLRDFTLRMKPQEIGDFLTELLKENKEHLSLTAFLAKVMAWSNQQGYTEKIIDFMLTEAKKLVGSEAMRNLLYEFIEAARQNYAGERADRKLADWLFNQGGFTPARLADIAQDKLQLFLGELYHPDNSLRQEIIGYFTGLPLKLRDSAWQATIENWKLALLTNKDLVAAMARFIRQKTSQSAEETLTPILNYQFDKACEYVTHDKALYNKVDEYLTNALVVLVEKYHSKIGAVAAKRLEQYTAEEIAALIEHKVSDDLQMIRLNGSTVGGLAGMLIFLLTYAWQ
ncbi:MAG: DUF445 domain-containing protein [Pelosinus sp.]|nr:DUF445 domain-containing protein [Pelosinus sp.]